MGGGDAAEGFGGVVQAGGMGRVGFGADDDEVVVHDVAAVDAVSVGDEAVLAGPVMDEKGVGVAAGADGKRLAGADGDDVDGESGLGLEEGENVPEEAGVLGGGGGAEGDEADVLGAGAAADGEEGRRREEAAAGEVHGVFGVAGLPSST